jgi:hypothetical protein
LFVCHNCRQFGTLPDEVKKSGGAVAARFGTAGRAEKKIWRQNLAIPVKFPPFQTESIRERFMKFMGIVMAGCMFCAGISGVRANQIANGPGGWQVTGNGVVTFTGSGIRFEPDTSVVSNPGLHNTGGTVSQNISTTPGTVYEISFSAFEGEPHQPTSFDVSFGNVLSAELGAELFNQCVGALAGFTPSSVISRDYFVTANAVPDAASTSGLLALAGAGIFFMRRRLGK